ncbi:Glucan endo-1 [Psidium guajava]|nr:Glucan endo-1 [Psidium guajava]
MCAPSLTIQNDGLVSSHFIVTCALGHYLDLFSCPRLLALISVDAVLGKPPGCFCTPTSFITELPSMALLFMVSMQTLILAELEIQLLT